jgi:flagellar motility protein MotE (MotC chaperone)
MPAINPQDDFMKWFILVYILSANVLMAKDVEKKYTQAEFDKQLKEQLNKQVDRLKNTSVAELTKELLEKESALNERELELKRKDEQLKLGEQELTKKVNALELEQNRILGCVKENQDKKSARYAQIVKVISNMKPTAAAEILSVQESDIAVEIISKLDAEKASKIFNLMDKGISSKLQKEYLKMESSN